MCPLPWGTILVAAAGSKLMFGGAGLPGSPGAGLGPWGVQGAWWRPWGLARCGAGRPGLKALRFPRAPLCAAGALWGSLGPRASGVAPCPRLRVALWFRLQDNKWHVCPGSHVLDPRDMNPGRAPGTLAPGSRDSWVLQMVVLH